MKCTQYLTNNTTLQGTIEIIFVTFLEFKTEGCKFYIKLCTFYCLKHLKNKLILRAVKKRVLDLFSDIII